MAARKPPAGGFAGKGNQARKILSYAIPTGFSIDADVGHGGSSFREYLEKIMPRRFPAIGCGLSFGMMLDTPNLPLGGKIGVTLPDLYPPRRHPPVWCGALD